MSRRNKICNLKQLKYTTKEMARRVSSAMQGGAGNLKASSLESLTYVQTDLELK